MVGVKLSHNEMQYITMLQGIVNVTVRDCIIDDEENKVIFVVEEGQAGMAIGKRGSNINRFKELIAKDAEVIEYSSNPQKFIKNCFLPIKVQDISIEKRKSGEVALVSVRNIDKGRAIGRNGKNIKKVKELVQRQFGNLDVIIKQ